MLKLIADINNSSIPQESYESDSDECDLLLPSIHIDYNKQNETESEELTHLEEQQTKRQRGKKKKKKTKSVKMKESVDYNTRPKAMPKTAKLPRLKQTNIIKSKPHKTSKNIETLPKPTKHVKSKKPPKKEQQNEIKSVATIQEKKSRNKKESINALPPLFKEPVDIPLDKNDTTDNVKTPTIPQYLEVDLGKLHNIQQIVLEVSSLSYIYIKDI